MMPLTMRRSKSRGWPLWLMAALVGLALPAQALPTEILVTPFEESARKRPVRLVPRIESRIAAKLSAVSPERLRALFDVTQLDAEAIEPAGVRRRAAEEEVDYLLFGRWALDTDSGAPRSVIELELRSGHSGGTAQRYALHLDAIRASGSEIEAEVTRVAEAMLDDLGLAEAPAPVAAGPSAPEEGERGRGKRGDFLKVERDQPIEINSEDLELRANGDMKRLIFRRDVSVVQGEMEMHAGYLEASYPNGASQPSRLDAREQVLLREGDLEVHCREATYLREDERVICRGDALLVQGCDIVRGSRIEFHIQEERVEVTGAASVVLQLDESLEAPECGRGGAG